VNKFLIYCLDTAEVCFFRSPAEVTAFMLGKDLRRYRIFLRLEGLSCDAPLLRNQLENFCSCESHDD
jgi:hypothetical protein